MVKCKKCGNKIKEKNTPMICPKCGNIMTPFIEKKTKGKVEEKQLELFEE